MLIQSAAEKRAALGRAFDDMSALLERQARERAEAYQRLVRAFAARLAYDTSGEPEC